MTKAKFIKFIIASILAIVALFLPYESLGFDAASPMGILNPLEIRVIGVFVMAALFWILQPFPIWSTSVLVIVLMIVTMSDSSLTPFRVDGVTMISHKSIMATFANPIIMLFLGGFFLAAAATKYKMDLNLARVLLKPFGKNPKFVLLGLMLITAVFSMFMSNTATAAMMLAILAPVLKLFEPDDRGKAAFALAIPLGANIGGMGTPIGTPPNAIALGALNDAVARGDLVANPVTFGQWNDLFFKTRCNELCRNKYRRNLEFCNNRKSVKYKKSYYLYKRRFFCCPRKQCRIKAFFGKI